MVKRKRTDPTDPPLDRPLKVEEIAPAKGWTFTWHFDDEEPYDWDTVNNNLVSNKKLEGGIVGEEICPTTKKKHFQGYVSFAQKGRPFTLGLPKKVHWEKAGGKPEHNHAYCSKEGKYKAWGTLKKFEPYRFELEGPLYPWQQEVLEILKKDPDPRCIYWIWESTGRTGKTDFGKHLHSCYPELGVFPCGGKAADMKNMVVEMLQTGGNFPRSVIVDLPRGYDHTHLSYAGLEEIKNMFFYSGKFHGGVVNGPKPHMVIFSNEEPLMHMLSADRWRVAEIKDRQLVW